VVRKADRSPLKKMPLRVPGQSLRNQTVDLALGRLLPALWLTSIACALTVQTWLEQKAGWRVSAGAYACATFVLAAVCALQFYYVGGRVERMRLGRLGELAVGQFLEQYLIRDGARVLHDVVAGNFNLDHVVIAPQGVFVIETKTLTKPRRGNAQVTFAQDGTLRVAGQKLDRDPITQVRASGRWLSELLTESTGQSVTARGVVVFPGWFVEPMTRAWLDAHHPWILEPKSLLRFLEQEPPLYSAREVTMFANHLSRYVRSREDDQRDK
jgi:Nuclease-related domain